MFPDLPSSNGLASALILILTIILGVIETRRRKAVNREDQTHANQQDLADALLSGDPDRIADARRRLRNVPH